VLDQGVIGDGDIDRQAEGGQLTGRFTRHLPSLRGRGLSGDHPDRSFGRLVDDVLAYVDSIVEPTGLVGWSLGGGLALLAAAAQFDTMNAVAAVGLGMPGLMDEQEQAAFGAAVARTGELAAAGDLTAAVRAFAGFVFNDDDIVAAEAAGSFEAAARYVPNMLNFFQQQMKYEGPMPDDPAVLAAISVPVLVLPGSEIEPYETASTQHLVDHVPNATVQEIPGAGHASPLTHPEVLAEALIEFLSPAQQSA
jgi:pimeloyl-ACP methyl ester carboxylesterase